MQTTSSAQLDAVFLFQGDRVHRELLLGEFEAILDGVVPLQEYAGGLAKAVFVRINAQLTITAAVFFVVEVDANGMVNRKWNVPLFQLLDLAARGPDLGSGPIKLVCFSQCPVEWQRNNLWDPQMEPGKNTFVMLRKRVADNRLGLIFKVEEAVESEPVISEADQQKWRQQVKDTYFHAFRNRLARIIKEQRLRITTLTNEHKNTLQLRQREHQRRLSDHQQCLTEKSAECDRLAAQVSELQQQVGSLTAAQQSLRHYVLQELTGFQSDEVIRHDQPLNEANPSKVDDAAREIAVLQERLDLREMELFYRQQQENNFKEEVAYLRQENEMLINQGGDYLLQRMQQAGIRFVTLQPGIGAVDLSVDDIATCVENPHAIASRFAGVSEAHYSTWLTHYNNPACQFSDARGQPCAQTIIRVNSPADFIVGESDCCELHQPHARIMHG